MIRRTCSGVARMMIEVSIELIKLDLPEPVAPATSRCGILVRSAVTKWPSNVLADAGEHRVRVAHGLVGAQYVAQVHDFSRSSFGISMPMADLPGIGERIRTSELATA